MMSVKVTPINKIKKSAKKAKRIRHKKWTFINLLLDAYEKAEKESKLEYFLRG